MSDLETFRAETRAWLEANCPPEMREPMRDESDACWGGRNPVFKNDAQKQWMEVDGRARLDRARLAEGLWRRRPLAGRDQDPEAGNGADRRPQPADELRHLDARPGSAQIWHRGAEAALPARDRPRRDPLVPGLFRARRRLRPRQPADQMRGQGRSLAGQRPEGLDQLCRQGRLDLLPGPHRSRRRPSIRGSASCCSTWRARASRPSRSC